jgi:hypothetical protein
MTTQYPSNREHDASKPDEHPETEEQKQKEEQDQSDKLDEAIEMTFPASDPISI